jgi:hypothetical protein
MDTSNENHEYSDRLVRDRQRKAERQADQLRKRAELLRRFAEKYRDTSASQLYGWEKLLDDEQDTSM